MAASEPIYQVMVGGKWVDSTAAEYAAVSNDKRIVYALPLPRVAATVALTDEQRSAISLALSFLQDKNITQARDDAVNVICALLSASNGEQA
jgi:hypothetical protein